MRNFSGFVLAFGAVGFSSALAFAGNDYALTSKRMVTPAHLVVNTSGLSEFDKKAWKIEKQDDGTELYTSTTKPEARAAIMRNSLGELDSMTTYKVGSGTATEEATSALFEKGVLKSYTSCENRGEKDIGRVCVTATADLCRGLKTSSVRTEDMKQMDTFEMRALAILLTLRGADHQLDNMAKTGNRLGLKTALQTTKGQLLTLARQVAAETARAPAAVLASAKAAADSKLAQTILERSLPRLKQACLDTKFN